MTESKNVEQEVDSSISSYHQERRKRTLPVLMGYHMDEWTHHHQLDDILRQSINELELAALQEDGGGQEKKSNLLHLKLSSSLISIPRFSVVDLGYLSSVSQEHNAFVAKALELSSEIEYNYIPEVPNEVNLQKRIQVRRILQELVETEESYVKRLSELELHFIKHLAVRNTLKGVKSVVPQEIVEKVFLNIPVLKSIHQALYDKISKPSILHYLGESRENDERVEKCELAILQCLIEFASEPSVCRAYSEYLIMFDESQEIFQNELKKSRFQTFVKINEAMLGRKVDSMRLEPIQRVPRYLLMLAEVQKVLCSTSEEDLKKNVEDTMTSINDFILKLELSMGIAQGRELLQSLQKELLGNKLPLDNGNRFCVRQGEIMVCHLYSQRTNGPLDMIPYFVLMLSDMLMLCSGGSVSDVRKASSQSFKPKKFYWLKSLQVIDEVNESIPSVDQKNCFEIHCSESARIEMLVFRSQETRNEWMEDLRKYIYVMSRLSPN